MKEAGLEAVAAKAGGQWHALDEMDELIEPDDLGAALDSDGAARRNLDGFPRSAKRGILEWVLSAKRPNTRARRITETVSEAAAGRRANQWRKPPSTS